MQLFQRLHCFMLLKHHIPDVFSLSKGKTNNSVVLVPFAKYIPYEELIKRSDFIMAHLPSPIAHDNSDDCFNLNYTTFDWDKFIDNWNDEYFDEWKEIHAKDSYGKGDDTNWEDAKDWWDEHYGQW